MVFTTVFAGGCLLAGLAGVIGGNYQTTEPGMADAMGPIVFVVVVFGGLGSLAGCFIASILMGMIQTVRRRDRLFPRSICFKPLGHRRVAATICWPKSSPCRWRGSARCCRSR